jgi:primosomal protein N' (replication factor Y) (superfamily II helicase)
MSKTGPFAQVVVQTPAHSNLAQLLTYKVDKILESGSLVCVPLGKRLLLGLVWQSTNDLPPDFPPGLDPDAILPIAYALDSIAPMPEPWRQLVSFTAQYYQRSLGEVAINALPVALKNMSPVQLARRMTKLGKREQSLDKAEPANQVNPTGSTAPDLSAEQSDALAFIASQPGPFLLHGATGSGKTEVYLRAAQALLEQDPRAQVLIMVPEINLTPQLQRRFADRFTSSVGPLGVVALHSGMTEAQRFQSWVLAHSGTARIVLGTRLAVLASIPHLRLIVVDEEHDPSYKAQDGARFSARDLAVYRASQAGPGVQGGGKSCKVILGSATPSLESWHLSRPAAEGGRYQRITMAQRIGQGQLPRLVLVNMKDQPKGTVLCAALLEAIKERIGKGEQALLFLNRRGYAPVLQCLDCGWKSQCRHCSAFRVFHKQDRTLRCHHCGFTDRVPRACPDCGNLDILPQGRGTEQLEENVAQLLTDVRRPDGEPVRLARLDADTTKAKGSLEQLLAQIHSGDVDVVVGTQMIAKGHDFRRITLVAAVNPDSALFSSDFRAPERLFSLLMQAAGRAGRDAAMSAGSEIWIQTYNPTHGLFKALAQHDYPRFAAQQLQERLQAQLSPYSFSALIRADGKTQEAAQAFLNHASQAARDDATFAALLTRVSLYSAVPMTIARVANVERAQMMVESTSRAHLQRFLQRWQDTLRQSAKQTKGLIRWAMDVDPLTI